MYRIADFISKQDTMHFVVSNLIHRGGWILVDASIDGATAATWPSPTESTPAMVGATWAVLRPPHSGLQSCGDRVWIELDAVTDSLNVDIHRLNGGATAAWDATGHAPAAGVSTISRQVDFAAGQRVYLFSSGATVALLSVDVGANSIVSGSAFGYLETAVLRDGNVAPVLGSGEDPYPLCAFDLRNAKAGGPPAVFTSFGLGECFSEADAVRDAQSVVQMWAPLIPTAELHDEPVQFGGGVPIHTLSKVVVMMDDGTGTFFLRGTFPTVHLTSRDAAESVLRVEALNAEYLVPAAYVAIGPR